MAVKLSRAAPVDRARYVISEIRGVLQWYFDDGQLAQTDAQLAELVRAHEGAFSQDALAAALADYGALAAMHRDAIAGLGGFDAALIDEAPLLAERLRDHSAGPAAPEPSVSRHHALELRNRVGALLYERVQRVRRAARFVFRWHPKLVRQVTSSYARQQRASHRRRKAEEAAVQVPPAVVTQPGVAPRPAE